MMFDMEIKQSTTVNEGCACLPCIYGGGECEAVGGEKARAELCRLLGCADHGWAYVIGQIQGRLELKSLASGPQPVVP
jgi:hypothetical protein